MSNQSIPFVSPPARLVSTIALVICFFDFSCHKYKVTKA
jgi:hypothetical protein